MVQALQDELPNICGGFFIFFHFQFHQQLKPSFSLIFYGYVISWLKQNNDIKIWSAEVFIVGEIGRLW